MTVFVLNMNGFVLNTTYVVQICFVFVLNRTELVLNMNRFVLNITAFVLNMTGF